MEELGRVRRGVLNAAATAALQLETLGYTDSCIPSTIAPIASDQRYRPQIPIPTHAPPCIPPAPQFCTCSVGTSVPTSYVIR